MKNGYYLSVYCDINPYAYIAFGEKPLKRRHDHNLALWQKENEEIKLIHYWELERITGLKMHDQCFQNVEQAKEFINGLLAQYNLTLDDMEEVWGTSGIEKNYVASLNKRTPYIAYHTLAHLYSGMLCETEIFYKEDMITLAVDGGADNVIDKGIMSEWNFVACYSFKGTIKDTISINSPGFLWGAASDFFQLREGTLMALGSASESSIDVPDNLIEQLIDEYTNKIDIKIQNVYLDFVKKLDDMVSKAEKNTNIKNDSKFTDKENHISIVMKIIQAMSIQIMESNVSMILNRNNVNAHNTYLSVVGGYALNCPTNSFLMEQFGFKGFIAPPCVSDSGISLGIGLYEFHMKMEHFVFSLKNAYHGNSYRNLDEVIAKGNLSRYIKSISKLDRKKIVEDIIEAPIIWFNDSAEIGPRALGNRSIIADPRSETSRKLLNEIKQREWWRPVAPIVMEEEVNNWFESAYASPYMLHTFKIRESKQEKVPAIMHLDRSARVQTMGCKDNCMLYEVLNQFKEITGVPILCNTSLNDKGEPIIDNILEAFNFALRKQFKVIYINEQRVELENQTLYNKSNPEERKTLFCKKVTEDDITSLHKKYNPLNLTNELIRFNFDWEYSDLFRGLKLTNEKDVNLLEKYYKMKQMVWSKWR